MRWFSMILSRFLTGTICLSSLIKMLINKYSLTSTMAGNLFPRQDFFVFLLFLNCHIFMDFWVLTDTPRIKQSRGCITLWGHVTFWYHVMSHGTVTSSRLHPSGDTEALNACPLNAVHLKNLFTTIFTSRDLFWVKGNSETCLVYFEMSTPK